MDHRHRKPPERRGAADLQAGSDSGAWPSCPQSVKSTPTKLCAAHKNTPKGGRVALAARRTGSYNRRAWRALLDTRANYSFEIQIKKPCRRNTTNVLLKSRGLSSRTTIETSIAKCASNVLNAPEPVIRASHITLLRAIRRLTQTRSNLTP